MPARKSNASTGAAEDTPRATSRDDALGVEDLNLPKSIVQRLAKGVLPPNTQIQKDALLAMSKSATVFVNYITTTAHENAARQNKKTIMPKDIYEAMLELEFQDFLPRLQAEVEKFTSIQADKRNSYRKKIREEKKAAKDPLSPSDPSFSQPLALNGHTAGGAENDESPPAKRARRSSVDNGEHAEGSGEDSHLDETIDEEHQDDEEVEDDEVEDEVVEEQLAEDPLEEREDEATEDDLGDGDESD
ncbi:histone-fold-containing protein [Amniculicola lignicola CBS 123094]|uniref:DNA polymerase epsilon subunit D n=1 Tax=Amniculicola lignicola CBS 123094 TaxID=1392246 RepID=A0A6A5WLX5_9PLEO|nr:histone-fold-containing protein [Amniculicola lignicola CBS 123094]